MGKFFVNNWSHLQYKSKHTSRFLVETPRFKTLKSTKKSLTVFDLRDETKAVMVVKHDYQTKQNKKYLGNINENYPRKNWSSVILWNCKHDKHKVLTPDFVSSQTGKFLHRFSWLDDDDIGEMVKSYPKYNILMKREMEPVSTGTKLVN